MESRVCVTRTDGTQHWLKLLQLGRLFFITQEKDVGEIVYRGEKIKSDASSKHNLADISEPLYPYVATKCFVENQVLHLFIKKSVLQLLNIYYFSWALYKRASKIGDQSCQFLETWLVKVNDLTMLWGVCCTSRSLNLTTTFFFGLGVVSRHHIPWPLSPLKKLSHYGIPAHPISQKYSLRLFTFLLLTVALRKEMEKKS